MGVLKMTDAAESRDRRADALLTFVTCPHDRGASPHPIVKIA